MKADKGDVAALGTVHVLFQTALVESKYVIADRSVLVSRVYKLMSKVLGVDPNAPLQEVEVPENEEKEETEEEDSEDDDQGDKRGVAFPGGQWRATRSSAEAEQPCGRLGFAASQLFARIRSAAMWYSRRNADLQRDLHLSQSRRNVS